MAEEIRMSRRLLVLAFALLLLGACSSPFEVERPNWNAPWVGQDKRSALGVIRDRQAPRILAVYEKSLRKNSVMQRVVLSNDTTTPNENYILVELTPDRDSFRDNVIGDPVLAAREVISLTEDKVDQLLEKEFPFARLRKMAPDRRRNDYGPYLYATAQTGTGVNCILIWQTSDAAFAGDPGRARREHHGLYMGMRLRWCAMDIAIEDMLDIADAFELRGVGVTVLQGRDRASRDGLEVLLDGLDRETPRGRRTPRIEAEGDDDLAEGPVVRLPSGRSDRARRGR